jgi:ferredoxin-NADP reductase
MHQQSKNSYTIIGRKTELSDVVTLQFVKSSDASVPTFLSGQYIDVYHANPDISEGKSYSISSVPGDHFLSITVKIMGEFSRYLANLHVGDTLIASDPYGYFYTENNETKLIFVVAGIGITPIMSMITFYLTHEPRREMELLYSNSFIESILFRDELREIEKKNPNVKVTFFVTREESVRDGYEKGRISPSFVVASAQKDMTDGRKNEYFICGSIHFVKDMWNGLRTSGVAEEYIYTEAFFSH